MKQYNQLVKFLNQMSDSKNDPTPEEPRELATPTPPAAPVTQEEPKSIEKPEEKKSTPPPRPRAEKQPSVPNPLDWFASSTSSVSSWGIGFINTAKEKTLNTIELVKKDLNEITDTVSTEATSLATATTEQLKQQAQLFHKFVTTPDGEDPFDETKNEAKEKPEGTDAKPEGDADAKPFSEDPKQRTSSSDGFGMGFFKTLVDTVKSFGIEDTIEDENTTEKLVIPQRKSLLDQYQLTQLQLDERTYTTSPTESLDLYKEWLEDFKIGEYNGEINMLLGYNPKLREIYAKLVPAKVENHVFWNRYFFKVYLAELDKQLELNEKKVFDELKVETDSSKLKADKIRKNDSSNTLDSAASPDTKDETWSMCSSTNADIQEIEDEDPGNMTPRPKDESSPEDWEKLAKEEDAPQKS